MNTIGLYGRVMGRQLSVGFGSVGRVTFGVLFGRLCFQRFQFAMKFLSRLGLAPRAGAGSHSVVIVLTEIKLRRSQGGL